MFSLPKRSLRVLGLLCALLTLAAPSQALDTDIYQSNVKQNCYILLDASGSMGFGVYESNIDYGAMFDELFTRNDSCDNSSCYEDYIYDTVNNSDYFYQNHEERYRIYLLPGEMGITSRSVDGETILFAGDAANPDYLWHSNELIDTYTVIDNDGNLSPANPAAEAGDLDYPRLTVDDEGYVLFDGQRLPYNQNVEYRHQQLLYGGGVIEDGFGDLINAPGYYFSGFSGATFTDVGDGNGDYNRYWWDSAYHYYHVDPGTGRYTCDLVDASGDGTESTAYFFITGNWMNMQQMYNLHYTTTSGAAKTGEPAWELETVELAASTDWPQESYALKYPETGSYEAGIEHVEEITHPGADKMKIHFDTDQFDINPAGANNNKKDWVIILDSEGDEVARYNNDDLGSWDGWTPEVPGSTVRVVLDAYTDSSSLGSGYVVDAYRYYDGAYKMKNRLEIAVSSMLNTIEHFRGQINWGTFTFPVANGGDGATSQQVINPNLNDDENRENIAADFSNVTPGGGTPIGEALQEVFEVGYYQHRNSIDNLSCRKNYTIVLSDGFPSEDNNWGLISDINSDPHLPFDDWDGDGFTSDPYQPPTSENYYDDVAHWMYTHSWLDKTEVTDPANSYVNVSSHQISFGFQNPLMEDAADEAGGLYITAYNEGQLNAAFYAIGLAIAEAVSFTAPVVSVDAANKIQNGNDLYMGQFIPMDSGYWPGNLKKFKLGDGSERRPDVWEIYDAGGNNPDTETDENLATNSDGTFKDPEELIGFWRAVDPDYVGLPIHHDGVGEILTKDVNDNFTSGNYYNRNIFFDTDSGLADFSSNITADDLGGVTEETKDKIINLVYGYTFDADADGDPVAPRQWALGPIIHSRPVVIDYYDTSDYTTVNKRLIAVGADDGMLHVFLDSMASDADPENATDPSPSDDGSEVFAYVPSTVLTQLKDYEEANHLSLVDGSVKLYREDGQPKYLFFGLRRGGRNIIRIDIEDINPNNWTIDEISPNEIPQLGQSWSDFEFATIQTGDQEYKKVVIFSGGYDPYEDNFPEPFNDLDLNGTPYADNGQIDGSEWDKNNAEQDVYASDNDYTLMNPVGDSIGRGIFILDIDSLDIVFSVTYDDDNSYTADSGVVATETRSDMVYCFPASPSVITLAKVVTIDDVPTRIPDMLQMIYAPDIYGNLFRISPDYAGSTRKWHVAKLFSANPASSSESSELRQGTDNTDIGRKVFYSPTVSWQGTGRYFDPSNYSFSGYSFINTGKIASVFFGTGDREHPTYTMIRNRVYAVYDDIPVVATDGLNTINVSPAPYTEDDLLNLTCDELGINTTQQSLSASDTLAFKTSLQTLLLDDVNNNGLFEYPSSGAAENDAKGWYIILSEQGDNTYCAHCDYEATIDDAEGGRDYHFGEKILSKLTLFAGTLYFTSYQPAYDDPCVPEGNAFSYALNYLNASAALNLNIQNDDSGDDDPIRKDVTDRYGKYSAVKGIPSGFEIVIRNGEAGAMASLGGGIIGGGEDSDGDGDSDFEIPYEDSGISLFYWIER